MRFGNLVSQGAGSAWAQLEATMRLRASIPAEGIGSSQRVHELTQACRFRKAFRLVPDSSHCHDCLGRSFCTMRCNGSGSDVHAQRIREQLESLPSHPRTSTQQRPPTMPTDGGHSPKASSAVRVEDAL